MQDQWFIVRNDKEYGPYPDQRLRELAKTGDLHPDDLVRREGMTQARKAGSLKGLFPESTSPVVDSPPPLPREKGTVAPAVPPVRRSTSDFRFDWTNWNGGGKLILLATCLAIFSLPFNWLELGNVNSNGFSQGGIPLLGFFIYPVLVLFENRPINFWAGMVCGCVPFVLVRKYVSSKMIILQGRHEYTDGPGTMVFSVACIVLIVAVVKYRPGTTRPDTITPPSI